MAKVITNIDNKYISSTLIKHKTNDKAIGLDSIIENTKLKKLWENSSPNSSFDAQDITLLSDDYDYLIIGFKLFISDTTMLSTIAFKGYGFTLFGGGNAHIPANTDYVGAVYKRICTRKNDTTFTIPIADVHVGNSTSQGTNRKDYCPPIIIYGGKF